MLRTIFSQLFDITSIWFFVFQSIVWFAICLGVVVSIDVARPERSYGKIKQNLGFLLLFIVLSSSLLYIMFGRTGAQG
ncbi:MAG: hypothetical protein A2804_01070 [Candidatus Pacebacteria bacterium RIFCSPHIGHO2_01_FULL_46_10]|nr:MAG: hypothetical protein A2804_01070 [Candidatus Pacebacteria bacterium RIFCSPHIGHO2_01_FULL_46_10]